VSKSGDINDTISAIAEIVNSRYKGRAFFVDSADMHAMTDRWRNRLKEALKASGKSMREVSMDAGCGPGYLHDVLAVGKEPTIDRLMRIANVLNVSLSWLLYGFDLGKKDEELLTLFASLTERQRQAILDLARPDSDNDQ
jgi:transcriptional regulator with XRE-family HTH domain